MPTHPGIGQSILSSDGDEIKEIKGAKSWNQEGFHLPIITIDKFSDKDLATGRSNNGNSLWIR